MSDSQPAQAALRRRSSQEVMDDHLAQRKKGDLEADLARNYDPDVTLMSAEGIHHGFDGVRYLARVLRRYVPKGNYEYKQLLVDSELAMMVWSGHVQDHENVVHDGVDTYVLRDGKIVGQTIHFSSYD